jgi:hypothetical protein
LPKDNLFAAAAAPHLLMKVNLHCMVKTWSAGWRTVLYKGTGMRKLLPALWLCFVAGAAIAAPKSNSTTINILAGEASWLFNAAELADTLDHENGLRILPMLGGGSVLALSDLSHIQSVDAAIVSSDSLAYAKTQGLIALSDNSLKYVATLDRLNILLITSKDIKNVTGLAGKRIATGPAQSASFATGELLFGAYEIPFTRIAKQGVAALQELQTGHADAALILGNTDILAKLDATKFNILPLVLPPNLQGIYQASTLNAQDFPGLIGKSKAIYTLSTSLILAVHDWPRGSNRYFDLQRFEQELYKAAPAGTNALNAPVLGWALHSSAQSVLSTHAPLITPTGGTP